MILYPSPATASRSQRLWSAADCSHSSCKSARCTRVLASSRDSYGHSGDSFSMPERLDTTDLFRERCREGEKPSNATVYTVRLETGTGRKAGMDDLYSGVQLCLMGKTDALLHRVGQFKEENRTEDVMADICEIVGPEAGAACSPGSRLGERVESDFDRGDYIQRRFQSGSIDEVCFIGPDIGPLKAVVVGPEEGAWNLDEVIVSSSAGARTQRFMCREHLGQKSGKGAAVLKVVPEGKVVYGSGERATLISVREAERMKSENMGQYIALKRRILTFTGVIISSGLVVAGATGGSEAAQAFALGGILAVAYQLALNRSVDAIPLGIPGLPDAIASEAGIVLQSSSNREGGSVMSAGGNNWNTPRRVNTGGMQRQALVGAIVLGALYWTQAWEDANGADEEVHQLSILITAMLGFASYKVAVVAAALTPTTAGVPNDIPAKKK